MIRQLKLYSLQFQLRLMTDVWRQCVGYNPKFQSQLRSDIEEYMTAVIVTEWVLVQQGQRGSLEARTTTDPPKKQPPRPIQPQTSKHKRKYYNCAQYTMQ
jgi:hypothetical protein